LKSEPLEKKITDMIPNWQLQGFRGLDICMALAPKLNSMPAFALV
jgi:hypothetical protein